MREYRIDVTQSDIDHGVRGSATDCPIARSWNRATGGGLNMFVPKDSMPAIAQQFMEDYDNGRAVAPFSFIMEVW